jgi:hypothetical protein
MRDNILDNLRRSLLWDVEDKKLDFEKDAQFVIGRVLDFANLKEWKIIEKFYGIEKIKKVAQNHIFFDRRSANFWAMVLNIPLENLKCTKKFSTKTPNAFLMR